jgi:DNA-binding LacI/PurR family transcriptional regulator
MPKIRDKIFQSKQSKFSPELILNPDSPVQLHHQMVEQIKSAIIKNRIPAGVPMIAELQIAKKTNTSRQTVHKAYAQLIENGIIEKKSGYRSFFISTNAKAHYRQPLPVLGIILPCPYSEFLKISKEGSMNYFSGVVDRANELKHSLMIINLPPVNFTVSEIQKWIGHLTLRLNGIVNFGITRTGDKRVFNELLEIIQIPHIFISSYSDRYKHISSVHEDITPGGIAAAQLLRDNGHRTVAIIKKTKSNKLSILPYAEKRGEIMMDIFSNSGLSLNEKWIASCDNEESSTVKAIRKIFSAKNKPTALWCQNDHVAKIAVSELLQMGLKVPEDVSVIGYDDSKEAIECNPRLTTIKMPNYLIGRLAADVANELFEHGVPGEAKIATVPTSLVIMDSVSKAKFINRYR